ncbi:MAG: hypothetical protein ACM3WV_08125 [Bacillota bacterium]
MKLFCAKFAFHSSHSSYEDFDHFVAEDMDEAYAIARKLLEGKMGDGINRDRRAKIKKVWELQEVGGYKILVKQGDPL